VENPTEEWRYHRYNSVVHDVMHDVVQLKGGSI
jgi:hypothetical protein